MIGTRSITDMYMVVLASLSKSDKLDLIAKLSNSMRDEADKKRMRPNLRTCFKGDWSNIDALEQARPDKQYHLTFVTVNPLERNIHSDMVESAITAEELFK